MTVAAVLVAPGADEALLDEMPGVRVVRLAEVAWAGGATPIVVVTFDPAGTVGSALAGGPATVHDPGDAPRGVQWFVGGFASALERVHETSAALLWPLRFCWVDAETVTSLIEAHGRSPDALVRPAFREQPGFPALVPAAYLADLERLGDVPGDEGLRRLVEDGVPELVIELGDPGIVHDASTARDDLPPFEGPPGPVGGPPPEWGAAVAAHVEEAVTRPE